MSKILDPQEQLLGGPRHKREESLMFDRPEDLFRMAAQDSGVVSDEQIEKCLQEYEAGQEPLLTVCIQKGTLNADQAQVILLELQGLNLSKRMWAFGQVAVQLGFATGELVLEALDAQTTAGGSKKIGEILCDMGILSEDQVHKIVSEQLVSIEVCESCFSVFQLGAGQVGLQVCPICGGDLGDPPS